MNDLEKYHGTAIVLANGAFLTPWAKTTHGLVRRSERFKIVAVVDPSYAGGDAGVLLGQHDRNIPITESVYEFSKQGLVPDWCIIGLSNWGGRISSEVRAEVISAINNGISVINTLHASLQEDIEIRELAQSAGVRIVDLRKPRPITELHSWTGEVLSVTTPRIAVLGTDCIVGKRTTATQIVDTCNQNGLHTELIFTGQTGWLQGVGKYGFILDSTVNDFVNGEIEHAIVKCSKNESPSLIVLEGQSGMRTPAGPGGPALLLSGGVGGVILQHQPSRSYYLGLDREPFRIPEVEDEIDLIERYGSRVLAVCLNTDGLDESRIGDIRQNVQKATLVPVFLPLNGDMEALFSCVRKFVQEAT